MTRLWRSNHLAIAIALALVAVGFAALPLHAADGPGGEVVATIDNLGAELGGRRLILVARPAKREYQFVRPRSCPQRASGKAGGDRRLVATTIVVGLPSLAPPPAVHRSVCLDVAPAGIRVGQRPVMPGWRGNSSASRHPARPIQQISAAGRHAAADIAAFTAISVRAATVGHAIGHGRGAPSRSRGFRNAVRVAYGESRRRGEDREQGGVHYEAVPTNLASGPDGAVYLSDLTGAPFPEGASIVWRWDGHAFVPYAEGFTTAIDLAFGPDGSLYVVENRSIIGLSGRVIRQAPNGTRTVVIDNLNFPTGIAVGDDGAVYVSNCGVCAGGGEVAASPLRHRSQ